MSNTNSKHTPLPWKLALKAGTQDMTRIKSEKGQTIADAFWMGEGIEQEKGIANAELIVKAVNSHEELVEALNDAKIQVEALNNFLLEHGTVNAKSVQVLNKIDNALKNAGVK